ncbi:hypothetical protein BD779DRAFT_1671297 [Infundibulicybe gibba]|nr:hypothetical protein BD779DRAFT_1671297 [Infundibulicybe gibba]
MILAPVFISIFIIASFNPVASRKWRDTGGTIALEEAWTVPALLDQIISNVGGAPLSSSLEQLAANLLDIHNQRLSDMNANGIDFMVISCASPCIQGISDPVLAEQMAVDVNNQLAASISNSTDRFGGFASLSMHNATAAALELNRTVTELGFLGALVNDYQQSGADNTTLLFYDQPEYDVFWQMVTDLDVPVYFHPRDNIAQISQLMFSHARYLEGPAQEFATTLSTHILGLCTDGVFDRFPKLKIIVGHLGERIPSDLFRIDEQLRRQLPQGLPMLRNASSYWRTNLFETTSGNFATPLLKFHIDQIGLDRILYSVDYPFASISEGAAWIDSLSGHMDQRATDSLKRGVAIDLLKLNQ